MCFVHPVYFPGSAGRISIVRDEILLAESRLWDFENPIFKLCSDFLDCLTFTYNWLWNSNILNLCTSLRKLTLYFQVSGIIILKLNVLWNKLKMCLWLLTLQLCLTSRCHCAALSPISFFSAVYLNHRDVPSLPCLLRPWILFPDWFYSFVS